MKARIALVTALLIMQAVAQSQEVPDVTGVGGVGNQRPLDTITVVGTRTERALGDVAATVSVIDAEDVERELARDIADLVRFEAGVSVSGAAGRFGLDGFTIRGIGGNRVLTLVDGVRVPEGFSIGPFLSARRDFVDIDSLERAEIARGPISSLYGSDAMGGVVAFTTKGPRHYLDADAPFYGSFKGGYSSADGSGVGTLTFAAGNERVSGLLLYTARDGSEMENQGTVGGTGLQRELPDPQEFRSDNIVAKLSWHPADNHELTLAVDRFDNETDSRLLSDYDTVVFGTTIDRRDAHDERSRTRYSLRYDYEGELPLADSLELTLYHQASATVQHTDEDRTTAANEARTRERISWFNQDIDGAYLQFGKALEFGATEQLFTYGLDFYRTDNAALRDGGSFDAAGNPVFEFLPLPTRDFPLTQVEQTALFLQDEISLFDDALRLSPGLRYDRFDATTTVDDVYLNGNPGTPLPLDYTDSEVTARFGILYAFTDAWSAYAQYSEGFRAPPYSDVNLGFSHFIAGYKSIPNPGLTSERSKGWEFGMRMQGSAGSVSVGVFDTDYDDFIESRAIAPAFLPSGIDPADGLITFQSINRDDVEIRGAELSGSLELGAFLPSLEGFSLRTAIAYANGEDKSTNEPLNSIEPLTGVLGVNYTAQGGRWGGELVGTFVDGKDESDIDPNNPRIRTAGYGILDLLAYTRITDKVSVNFGLFNLTDRSYIRWADTAAIGASAPARFSQPGFNAGANIRIVY